MVAVLPDLTAVWLTQNVNRVPFSDLDLPFGVICIPSLPRDPQWGADSMVFAPHAELWVVMEQDWDSLELAAKLELIRDYMTTTAVLANGSVWRVEELNWSDDLEPNRILTDKKSASRAGRVVTSLLIVEIVP